jgi:hypothetical protein
VWKDKARGFAMMDKNKNGAINYAQCFGADE